MRTDVQSLRKRKLDLRLYSHRMQQKPGPLFPTESVNEKLPTQETLRADVESTSTGRDLGR
jgi:hypothetical protein